MSLELRVRAIESELEAMVRIAVELSLATLGAKPETDRLRFARALLAGTTRDGALDPLAPPTCPGRKMSGEPASGKDSCELCGFQFRLHRHWIAVNGAP